MLTAQIANLDILGVIVLLVACAIVGIWMFRTMTFTRTLYQEIFMGIFMMLLGAFILAYFRSTKDMTLIAAMLIFLIMGWIIYRARGMFRGKGMGSGMRMIVPVLLVPLLLSTAFLAPSVTAYKTDMHKDLVDSVFETLDNDGRTYAVRFFEAKDLNGVSLRQWVKDGITDCDRLDLARNHYYNPSSDSGLTALNSADLCQEMFDTAIEEYENGNYARSAYDLGRAMHMVMDSTLPHHSTNDALNGHSEYEAWILDHEGYYLVSDGGLYNYSQTARDFVVQNAEVSSPMYEMVESSNASEANYETVANIIEPLAIRSSAGLITFYLSEVLEMEPTLWAIDNTNSAIELSWSPCPDQDFVSYKIYVSDANKEIVQDEEHLFKVISDRDRNTLEIKELRTYGKYQFQIVTVLSDGSMSSNIVEQRLGFTAFLIIGGILGLGALVAVLFFVSGGNHRRKK